MNKVNGISGFQYAMTAGGSVLIVTYSIMPVLKSDMSSRIIIPVLLLSFLFILIFNIPFIFIANKMKEMTFKESLTALGGSVFGKVIAYLLFALCIVNILSAVVIISTYTKTYLLGDTPQMVVLLFALFPACYAAYKGAGTLTRMSSIIFPLVILTIIIFFLFGIPKMNFSDLAAVSKLTTFGEIVKNALLACTRYSEIVIIFIFGNFLTKKKKLIKSYWLAVAVYIIGVILIVLPSILVVGAPLSKVFMNPYFIYSRQVGGGDFAQRIQSINIITWFVGAVMRIAIYIFMAAFVLSGTFKKLSYKKLVFPIGLIIFIVCAIPAINNFNVAIDITNTNLFSWINLAVVFVLPIILGIVYFFKRKSIKPLIEQAKAREQLEESDEDG